MTDRILFPALLCSDGIIVPGAAERSSDGRIVYRSFSGETPFTSYYDKPAAIVDADAFGANVKERVIKILGEHKIDIALRKIDEIFRKEKIYCQKEGEGNNILVALSNDCVKEVYAQNSNTPKI